jgi:hypothetical protein
VTLINGWTPYQTVQMIRLKNLVDAFFVYIFSRRSKNFAIFVSKMNINFKCLFSDYIFKTCWTIFTPIILCTSHIWFNTVWNFCEKIWRINNETSNYYLLNHHQSSFVSNKKLIRLPDIFWVSGQIYLIKIDFSVQKSHFIFSERHKVYAKIDILRRKKSWGSFYIPMNLTFLYSSDKYTSLTTRFKNNQNHRELICRNPLLFEETLAYLN